MQNKITLSEIKAAQATLADMIAKFEANNVVEDMFPINIGFPQLNANEKWLGVVVSANGLKKEHIILLPEDKDEINWQDAMQWAESIGGHLPDRVEQALLFKCLKDEFEEEAYWSCEELTSRTEWAWCQGFDNGYQDYDIKDFKLRARAVRRVSVI
ncbi:MAG: hypothetical protein WBP13_00705 [Methylophilaceae bacterium]